MNAVAFIRRTAEYDYWANRTVLESLSATDGKPEKAVALFGHILNAQFIWHGRMTGLDVKGIPVFPAPNLDECGGKIEDLFMLWGRLLDTLTDDSLGDMVEYVTTQGVKFSTSAGDLLTHVFLHSAYHRGQIALLLRADGAVPAITDFIAFARL